jgi:uncharacterized membrane protein
VHRRDADRLPNHEPGRRNVLSRDTGCLVIHDLAMLIEAVGSLLLCGFVVAGGIDALRGRAPEHVRLLLADGAILALSFKVGAALLTTMDLPDWNRIAVFAAIFALRTVLKRVLVAERVVLAQREQRPQQTLPVGPVRPAEG